MSYRLPEALTAPPGAGRIQAIRMKTLIQLIDIIGASFTI
jgi:hypothetical protein